MNYKETLFFIGKCLTINYETHNKNLVEKDLKADIVDWDSVVKVSTGHFVFPALYCNLKKANFLHYLPDDLVAYMQHITDLNRERNEQIIVQAKEINELLLENDITPIFLKGTGNLLEGLYEDIAERMVGDIDFLVAEEDCKKAYKILTEKKYTKVADLYEDHRHLNRLVHDNKIAAVEIHRKMLKDKYSDSFNYQHISSTIISSENIHFISLENQIKLTVFAKFINDDGYKLKNINSRAAYDVFCLFYNKNASLNLNGTDKLFNELNTGLILYANFLGNPKKILFIENENSLLFLEKALKSINNPSKKRHSNYLFFMDRLTLFLKAFYKKDYLKFILNKLTDRNWYKRRFGI